MFGSFGRRKLISLALLTALLIPQVSGASILDHCTKWLGTRPNAERKQLARATKTAELEIPISPALLDLITTQDGTLAPLLDAYPLPPALKVKFQSRSADQIHWSDLAYQEKIDLVSYVLKFADFHENRRIPGLILKDRFLVPTEFRGKSALLENSSGARFIDLRKWFNGGHIEMRGMRDTVRGWRGVELHLSDPEQRISAGALFKLVMEFYQIIKIDPTHFHMHVVSDFPTDPMSLRAPASWTERLKTVLSRLQSASETHVEAFQITEWIARVNTIFEMLSIRYANDPIHTRLSNINGSYSLEFDNLREYRGLYHDIYRLLRGSDSFPKDEYKIGYVGVRGPDTYRGKFWGLEPRALHPDIPHEVQTQILDLIEDDFHSGIWNTRSDEIAHWLELSNARYLENSALLLHWDQTENLNWRISPLVQEKVIRFLDVPDHLQPRKPGSLIDKEHRKRRFRSVQMLYFDWCATPIISSDRNLCQRILQAQVRAISSLMNRYPSPATATAFDPRPELKKFVDESGILERYIESLSW